MSFVLGLTGSIGMGKSTTADLFAKAGVPVWDADGAVHRLYQPDAAAAKALSAAFPGAMDKSGAVDRNALRAIVTADSDALIRLNAIVHPLVARDRAAFLARTSDPVVLLDVPLLYETGLDQHCDAVAVVTIDAATQRKRVLDRGTMTPDEFEAILQKQMPDAEKRRRADHVIVTDTIDHARAQVHDILQAIEESLPHA